MRGLSPAVASGGHSSSQCAGLSPSQPLSLRSTGSRRAGSAVVAHGPNCSTACGIFPDQGWNPRPLHWQADSQPLRHQGSPLIILKQNIFEMNSTLYIFFFKFYLFIYFWLFWVFISVRGLFPVVASRGHSSSWCAGLSPLQPLPLRSTSYRRAGSAVAAHGSSCSAARGILPDRGLNPCPLHWQADPQPLRHQGSPLHFMLKYIGHYLISS